MRWTEISDDPNNERVIEQRRQELRTAFTPPVPNRTDFIVERCTGRRVLDIGCVDHPIERHAKASWLHSSIASAASECVGADINPDGVRSLNAQGYTIVEHDISTGPGPLLEMAPFDVIVAGELIEHVSNPENLFKAAAALLAPGGLCILTTPNPYAPHRYRAGILRHQWENVDHLFYAFPSGIAELASRAGMRVVECTTTAPQSWKGLLRLSAEGSIRRLALMSRRRSNVDSVGVSPTSLTFWFTLIHAGRWSKAFIGETALYVLETPPTPEDNPPPSPSE